MNQHLFFELNVTVIQRRLLERGYDQLYAPTNRKNYNKIIMKIVASVVSMNLGNYSLENLKLSFNIKPLQT